MYQLFYFSDQLQPTLKSAKAALIITGRFFRLLLGWRKEIQCIRLDYLKKQHFENSYLQVSYQFGNMLWYRLEGMRRTEKSGVLVLDIRNLRQSEVRLTVYGFFRKKQYLLSVNPSVRLHSGGWDASVSGSLRNITLGKERRFLLLRRPPPISFVFPLTLLPAKRSIKTSAYHQKEFI